MSEKIMLLDGHSLMNRAYYGLPLLTNSAGQYTNGVLGFLNIMLRYVEEEKPTHLLVAFDRKEPTFRHIRYEAYKGTRKSMPEELREQIPRIKELLKAMEIPVVTQAGIEADDILGTIGHEAEDAGFEVVIVSGDRDLLQLATEKVMIKIPKTKAGKTITENYFTKDFMELYGVTPKEFIDMKGLMGDTSDNIPGVPGIGEKTAAKIIQQYHSIENAYEHIEELKPAKAKNNLKEFYDQAILSKELATIKIDCDLEYSFQDAKIGNLFNKNAYEAFKQLELSSLLKYFDVEESTQTKMETIVIRDLIEAEEIVNRILKEDKIGLGLAFENGECAAISLAFQESIAIFVKEGFLTESYFKDTILKLLEAGVEIAVMDYKKLLHFSEEFYPYEDQIDDIGIMAYLLNPLQSDYDYDIIAKDYLGDILPSRKELLEKTSLNQALIARQENGQQVLGFLAKTAFSTKEILRKKLLEKGMEDLYLTIEKPLVYSLYAMENYGVTVEKEALKEYGDQLVGKIEDLEKRIYEQAGKEFNINSPKQLGVVLFEDLKMPFAKKTKTGYSTNADILEKLKADYPIVADILEYRTLTKLKSTYADGLAAFIQEDGKIHGIFHQKVTATGRLSSSDPNLQNIPIRVELGRAIRKVFVPDPGYVFVSADYSQIELRILAHMAADENLLQAYQQDKDIHTTTASQVFGVPMDQVDSQLRRNAKAVNFGIVYGISAFGLSQDLNISRKEANDYIERYFQTYPGIKEYLDNNVTFAKENGYVATLYGRIRPIPEISSSNFMQRSFGERVAMNSAIQGTAADIIKIAMINVSKRLKKENLKSRLILQIHDELLIETAEDEVLQVRTILTEEMMGASHLDVPLKIEIAQGQNWYEAK
ncbi:MAG: DNA polymerase I [Eubacteriales bacterium]|nr:DNA polymerase I [Eubacteriales bacterium]